MKKTTPQKMSHRLVMRQQKSATLRTGVQLDRSIRTTTALLNDLKITSVAHKQSMSLVDSLGGVNTVDLICHQRGEIGVLIGLLKACTSHLSIDPDDSFGDGDGLYDFNEARLNLLSKIDRAIVVHQMQSELLIPTADPLVIPYA